MGVFGGIIISVVAIGNAVLMVGAYRQGIKDGMRKEDGKALEEVRLPKIKKKSDKDNERLSKEFEDYLRKEREGANNL